MTGTMAGRRLGAGGAAVTLLLAAGCVGKADPVTPMAPTTMRVGNTDVYSYQLVCPSPLGDLATSIEFTVTDSIEDLRTGETVTYSISAPLAQVDAPVTPTFESSTTTYAIPAGLEVTATRLEPSSNSDFTSTSTKLDGSTLSFTLNGSFPLDGSPRQTPTLQVDATVTATDGTDIVWMTPTSIVGNASVAILGTQTSSCSFPTSGQIGTTNVS